MFVILLRMKRRDTKNLCGLYLCAEMFLFRGKRLDLRSLYTDVWMEYKCKLEILDSILREGIIMI